MPQIPASQHGKLAKFLEANKYLDMAYALTPDLNHKFDLALQLNLVQEAFEIAERQESAEKWKKVGDIGLGIGKLTLAESCYKKSNDFNSLLLFYSSYGEREGLKFLAEKAE